MTGVRSRLVVVHHRAAATPETVGLVELVRALVAADEVDVEVLLFEGGPLAAELAGLAPTTVVADLDTRSGAALVETLLFKLRRRAAGYRRRSHRLGLDRWRPGDAVYLHTVLGVQVLRYLPERSAGGPTVACRMAEDAHPLRHPLTAPDLALLVRRVDRFLPVTTAGEVELLDEHRVPPDRVRKVPELFVPPDDRLPDRSAEQARLRAELGIAADALVVGSFGGESDAPDLGVMLWSMVRQRGHARPVELLWGAGQTDAGFWMEHDLRETGLAEGTHAIPDDVPLSTVLELCDVLVLLTRLDDHPFAYLERAAAGVPVLCFEGNSLADLVRRAGPANVVPYLDVVAVAEQVVHLLDGDDPLARRRDAMAEAVASVHGPTAFAGHVLDALRPPSDGSGGSGGPGGGRPS